ncbi:unnamed protein product [Auanema sp. JU1783]|nr:unnamed protein product [Auanema sp. JU1783]
MKPNHREFYRKVKSVYLSPTECAHVFPSSLIGFKLILSSVEREKDSKLFICEYPIRIAVPSYLASSIRITDYPSFEIIFYENNSFIDYFKFYADVTRVTPKFETIEITKDLHVPANPAQFEEYWKRSRLIDCHNLPMNRNNTSQRLPIETSLRALSNLRNVLTRFNMYPYLEGGTLLGWYRECSVIPHTLDMDFVVDISQLNPQFEELVRTKGESFALTRKLGDPKDSLEYTVVPSKGFKTPIDIFFMYQNTDEYWIAGTDGKGTKYRYSFPFYDPYCAGIIHGFVFWVTCSPDQILTISYGKEWYKDYPSSRFRWNSSSRNVRIVGKIKNSDLKKFYEIIKQTP